MNQQRFINDNLEKLNWRKYVYITQKNLGIQNNAYETVAAAQ